MRNDEIKKYKIIYADPPWRYQDMKNKDPKMGGIIYPTMELKDIKNLPVSQITDKDCILFMWATMPLLREALEVIEAWGFQYTTCAFVWIKKNPLGIGIYSGLGHWVNGNAELVLLGKKGHPKRIVKNIKQIQIHSRGRHSAKPARIRDIIVQLMGDIPRIELFARKQKGQLFEDQTFKGWDCIGDGVDDENIQTAIKKLIQK